MFGAQSSIHLHTYQTISSIFQDCLFMDLGYASCSFVHVKCQCNAIADYLAQKTFILKHKQYVVVEEYQTDLLPYLTMDVLSFTAD